MATNRPPGCTAREATLFFVPFYHFTGQEYSYNVREVAIDGGGVVGPRSFLMVEVRSFDLSEFAPDIESGPRIAEKRFEVSTKHISRSVPAVDAAGLNVFSLGIRPDVLKLSLFEKAAVSKMGRIAPVRVKPADADQIGFGHPGGEETVVRRVSGKVRSIIYFPFWLVEYDTPGGEARVAVLDAVSEEVSNLRAPLTVLDGLIDKDGQEFEVAGLRPLKCPNCAADLPVRPRDVVFFCGTCDRAWQIDGAEFRETPYKALKPSRSGSGPVYYPFWAVRARLGFEGSTVENKYDLMRLAPNVALPAESDKLVPLRFFVPAFEASNLNAVLRLASAFTRSQPGGDAPDDKPSPGTGCFITAEDALDFTPFVLFSLVPKGNRRAREFALGADVERLGTELVLVPFFRQLGDYVDGLYGLSLPAVAVRSSGG